MGAGLKRFDPELCHMKTAPPSLKVRMLKAEVVETLRYGFVTWTLSAQYFARLRSAHQAVFLGVIGFHRRQRTDRTTLSYPKTLTDTW